MKKHLVLVSLVFLTAAPLCAAPWGVLGHDHTAGNAGKDKKERWFTKNLINEVYDGKQITYCVEGDLAPAHERDYPTYIEDAFNSWFKDTRKYINASGRVREFGDLFPLFDRKVNLKQIDCPCGFKEKHIGDYLKFTPSYPCAEDGAEPKIYFLIGNELASKRGSSSSDSRAAHMKDEKTGIHFVIADVYDGLFSALQHEIGHVLGLGDQYDESLHNSLPQLGVRDELPSIMNNSAEIQCDDAEGIINLIDCFRRPPAEPFWRGGDKGWQSICPGRNITYAKCLAKGRADMRVMDKYGNKLSTYKYDKSGRLKKQKSFDAIFFTNPYNIYEKRSYTQEKRDSRGRLTYMKDTHGAETFFEYTDIGFKYYTVEDSLLDKNKRIATAFVEVYPSSEEKGGIIVESKDTIGAVRTEYSFSYPSLLSADKRYYDKSNRLYRIERIDVSTENNNNFVSINMGGDYYDDYDDYPCVYGKCVTVVKSYSSGGNDAANVGVCKYSGGYAACAVMEAEYNVGSEGISVSSFDDGKYFPEMKEIFADYEVNLIALLYNSYADSESGAVNALRESISQENMGYLLSYGDIGKFLRDTITASQIKFPESSQETEKEKIAALQNVILNRETPQERKQSAKFEKYYKKYLKEVTKSLNKELSDKAAAPAEAVAGAK